MQLGNWEVNSAGPGFSPLPISHPGFRLQEGTGTAVESSGAGLINQRSDIGVSLERCCVTVVVTSASRRNTPIDSLHLRVRRPIPPPQQFYTPGFDAPADFLKLPASMLSLILYTSWVPPLLPFSFTLS